jgi:hypothetical protein
MECRAILVLPRGDGVGDGQKGGVRFSAIGVVRIVAQKVDQALRRRAFEHSAARRRGGEMEAPMEMPSTWRARPRAR